MRSARQGSIHSPSVRTSSSHRSTIEPRGVPEFDRDYARQLSVAKRGRSGSVRPSPRPGSANESPLEETSIGHLQDTAAAAASRIKDYVATHVTPPRPLQSSTTQRASDGATAAAAAGGSSNGHGQAATPPPPLSQAAGLGVATRSVNEEGTAEATSPPAQGSGTSTRCGSTAHFDDAAHPETAQEHVALVILKTVVVCAVALFLVLCAVAVVASAERDYIPDYFSPGGHLHKSTTSINATTATAAMRSFPDRLLPQLTRQVGLRTRYVLSHAAHVTGVRRAARFCGWVLHSLLRPFTFMRYLVSEGVVSPLRLLVPDIDVRLRPTLRYIFSSSTDASGGWSVSKLGALLGSIVRSLGQLIVEPFFILGRTARGVGAGVTEGARLLSSPLVGQPPRNASAAVAGAGNRTSQKSVLSHVTSSLLLTLWRPLHSLWSMLAPVALGNTSDVRAPQERQRSPFTTRPPPTVPLTTEAPAAASPRAEPPRLHETEVRTSHRARLAGDAWASLLERSGDQLRQLAHDDLRELFGETAEVADVRLRSGSLMVDFVVLGKALQSLESEGGAARQEATQAHRDGQLAAFGFPRLHAFYEAAVAARRREEEEETASCDERVAACRHDCEAQQRRIGEELRACHDGSAAAAKACGAARDAAARDADSAVQRCMEEAAAMESRAAACAAQLTQLARAAESREAARQDCAAALAATQNTLEEVTSGRANESEVERQRCALKVAEAAQLCTTAAGEARAALETEHVRQLATARESCEAATHERGEERCARRLAEMTASAEEERGAAVQQAERRCHERVATEVGAVNRSAMLAVAAVEEKLDALTAASAQRLSACEQAQKQAQSQCATQLSTAQEACRAEERGAAAAECAAQLAAREAELKSECSAELQQRESQWMARVAHDVAAVNGSAATALAQLSATLDSTRREAEERVTACTASLADERERCHAAQRQLNVSWAKQQAQAAEACEAALQQRVEAERVREQQRAGEAAARQAAVLAAQCSADTRAAVEEAAAQLQERHTIALHDAVAAAERQGHERLAAQRAEAAAARLAAEEHLEAQVQQCRARLSESEREGERAAAQNQEAVKEARVQLTAYLAQSGEEACLRHPSGSQTVCAVERRKIEAALAALAAAAPAVDVLAALQRGSAAAHGGQLTWDFSRSGGAFAPAAAPAPRAARSGSFLHWIGMAVGLGFAVDALYRRQRDRRLYKDAVAQLNALIAANEATMASAPPGSMRSRRGRRDPSVSEAAASWAVAADCWARCTDALSSWHSTCCAVLLEQAANELLRDASAHSTRPSGPHDDPHHLSSVSPSTLPLTDGDASRVDSRDATTQMHASFLGTYYNILEMYYVDLLNAVANRELAERQLQEGEAVASRQAALLRKQSTAVAQLKRSLAEREAEVAQLRASPVSSPESGAAATAVQLARAERKTAAQQAMITLLEGQLKLSQAELDRVRGHVLTPARTPRSESGADGSAAARQVRSLQELAAVEGDSTNSSDFSNAGQPSPPQRATATPRSAVAAGAGEAQRSLPASAMKKPASMVRDPETTRRYQKLRWNDEAGEQ